MDEIRGKKMIKSHIFASAFVSAMMLTSTATYAEGFESAGGLRTITCKCWCNDATPEGLVSLRPPKKPGANGGPITPCPAPKDAFYPTIGSTNILEPPSCSDLNGKDCTGCRGDQLQAGEGAVYTDCYQYPAIE